MRLKPVRHHLAQRRRLSPNTERYMSWPGEGAATSTLRACWATYSRSARTGPSYRSTLASGIPESSATSAAVDPPRIRAWISRGDMGMASLRWTRLSRGPAGRHPKRFIDWQLEHLAAGPAQQEVLPVVVYAYKP